MAGSVSIVDNEILLSINDELEIRIAYRCPTPEDLCPGPLPKSDLIKRHEGIADVMRYAIQLTQYRRFRQNIKERTDSFFKSSRPGGGRAAGTYGQIQQTLQNRPTNMLSMILQALQYYTFSKRVRDVLAKSTRNLRQSWWEAIHLQSVDIKSPPPSLTTSGFGIGSAGLQTLLQSNSNVASPFRNASTYGQGSAVSIRVGMHAPPIRFVIRSHPLPCVVLQLSDRPSAPMAHIAEFEKVLEQELASRAIGRICDILNSINDWSMLTPGLRCPRFVIDIEQHCVGVFAIPQQRGDEGKLRNSHM